MIYNIFTCKLYSTESGVREPDWPFYLKQLKIWTKYMGEKITRDIGHQTAKDVGPEKQETKGALLLP